MNNLTSNPLLSKALKDPRFAMIFQGLKTDPAATMKKVESDPGMKQVVQELFKLVGNHFIALGEQQDSAKTPTQELVIQTAEEGELQRQADKALQNPNIREILSDPETRRVLNNCGNPDTLRRYMCHPVWGERIRVLQANGLVKFQT